MQTTGSFPALNQGLRTRRVPSPGSGRLPKAPKPVSNTGSAVRALNRDTQQTSIGPQKRRRQLTQQPATTGNPFSGLQALVGKALKGRGGY